MLWATRLVRRATVCNPKPMHIVDNGLFLGDTVAAAALRRKRTYEQQRDQLAGTRLTLEAQANAIESANMNAETMLAMKRGAGALKDIHKQLNIDKVRELLLLPQLQWLIGGPSRWMQRWTRSGSRWSTPRKLQMRFLTRSTWASMSTR